MNTSKEVEFIYKAKDISYSYSAENSLHALEKMTKWPPWLTTEIDPEYYPSPPSIINEQIHPVSHLLAINGTYLSSNISNDLHPYDYEDDGEYIFDKLHVRIIFFVLYSIVFCFCFFGNLAVVLVVTLHWKMRNITKFCLGNLAFANLCVGVFCVYQNLSTFLMNNWIFGSFLCKMYHFTNSLSHTASILILVVICVERYLAILHPLKCRQILTMQRLRIVIVAVWVISAVICSPRLYYINLTVMQISHGSGSSHTSDEPPSFETICVPLRTLYDSTTADGINFTLLFLFPLIVISILYTRVGLYLWKSSSVLRHAKNVGGRACSPFESSFPSDYCSSCTPSTSNNTNSGGSASGATGGGGSSSGNESQLQKYRSSSRSKSSKLKRFRRRLRKRKKDRESFSHTYRHRGSSPTTPPSLSYPYPTKTVNSTIANTNSLRYEPNMAPNHDHDHIFPPIQTRFEIELNHQGQQLPTSIPSAHDLRLNQSVNVNIDLCSSSSLVHKLSNEVPVPNIISNFIMPGSTMDQSLPTTDSNDLIPKKSILRSASLSSLPSILSRHKNNNCNNINMLSNVMTPANAQSHSESNKPLVKITQNRKNAVMKVGQIRWDKRLSGFLTTSRDFDGFRRNRKSGKRSTSNNINQTKTSTSVNKTLRDNSTRNSSFWNRLKKKTFQINHPSTNKNTSCSDFPIIPMVPIFTSTESYDEGRKLSGSRRGKLRASSCDSAEFQSDSRFAYNTRVDEYEFDNCPNSYPPDLVNHSNIIPETNFKTTIITSPGCGLYGISTTATATATATTTTLPNLVNNRVISSPSILACSYPSVSFHRDSGLCIGLSLSVANANPATNGSANGKTSLNMNIGIGNLCRPTCSRTSLTSTSAPSTTTLSRVKLVSQPPVTSSKSVYFNPSGKGREKKSRRSNNKKRARREKFIEPRQSVVRMLITIVVTFAICNLPFHVRKICQNYMPNYDFGSDFSYLITPLTFLLMYINCAINPILYAFMSKNFRSSFKDLIHCQLRKTLSNGRKDSSKIV